MWIAQISDPHVGPAGTLYGGVLDTAATLRRAVAQINALVPRPDLVVMSGDLVDDGQPDAYAHASSILAGLRPRLLAMPGNHDERAAFRAVFADRFAPAPDGPLHTVVDDAGPVRAIGLDVTVPGRHHGLFDEAAASWLGRVLAAQPNRPAVVVMHQPPLAIGVPYLDRYRCFGARRLAALLGGFPQVERVLCGHVHRSLQARFGNTLLCAAPSTATAIALRPFPDAEPASFIEPPGFLLHHWRPGVGTVTHAVSIGTFPGPFPFA